MLTQGLDDFLAALAYRQGFRIGKLRQLRLTLSKPLLLLRDICHQLLFGRTNRLSLQRLW